MICFLLGSLSGCASNRIEIPSWEVEPVSVHAQDPVRLPELPSPASSTQDTVTFTREGFQALLAYSIVAGDNQEIAQANADSLRLLSQSYNELVQAGKLNTEFAKVREEQLDRERHEHFVDN